MDPHGPRRLLCPLRRALSPEVLREILARDWVYLARRQLTLIDCQPLRVCPRDDGTFVLDYAVRLQHGDQERTERWFGEVVGDGAAERSAFLIKRLQKRKRAQLPADQPTDLVSSVPALGLVLRAAGLDERLKGLTLAFDRPAMRAALSDQLGSTQAPSAIRAVGLLAHRLGKRCVLRYQCDRASSLAGPRSVIAKVYKTSDPRSPRIFHAMQTLWSIGCRAGTRAGFRIPRPLAWIPQGDMVVMEDVLGEPMHELTDAAFEGAAHAVGLALAALHRSSTTLAVCSPHTIDDELILLARQAELVGWVYPELREPVQLALTDVSQSLAANAGGSVCLSHRDYYEKQVLRTGSGVILIDFDTLCLADPALDVGNFLAHVHLARWQRPGISGRPEEAFTQAYLETADVADAVGFEARVTAYTNAALLRVACLQAVSPPCRPLTRRLLEAVRAPHART